MPGLGLGIGLNKRRILGGFSPINIAGLQLWGKWNDSTTLTKDGSNYVQSFVDQSDNGVTYTQGTASDQPQWQNGNLFYFDGASDNFSLDDLLTYTSTDTQGTIFLPVKPVDATPTAQEMIFSWCDASAGTSIDIRIDATTGKCRIVILESSIAKCIVETNTQAFADNTLAILSITQTADTNAPKIHINNVEVAQTNTTSTNNDYWINSLPGLDVVRVACRSILGSGNSDFYNGSVGVPLYFNSALSDADRTSVYNFLNSIYS